MAAGYTPAPIEPGFAITVRPAGVVPLVGVTVIHPGGGGATVPGGPPLSTVIEKPTADTPVAIIAIVCGGAALPPTNAENASANGDTCNSGGTGAMVT